MTIADIMEMLTKSEIEICEFMDKQSSIIISKLREFLNTSEFIEDSTKKLIEEAIQQRMEFQATSKAHKKLCELMLLAFCKSSD